MGEVGLGSEHPHCDSIQLLMLILFFSVWGMDNLSSFTFGVSTVLIDSSSLPIRLFPAVFSFIVGVYLIVKSHEVIFGEKGGKPELIDSGVYSLVRHPMYLGVLVFCLAFFFVIPSLLSLLVWVIFFITYDKMVTYEEKDLIRILGGEYVEYQRRVSKWCPRLRRKTE